MKFLQESYVPILSGGSSATQDGQAILQQHNLLAPHIHTSGGIARVYYRM